MKHKTKTRRVNKVDGGKKKAKRQMHKMHREDAKKETVQPYRGNDYDYVSDKYHDDSYDDDYYDDSSDFVNLDDDTYGYDDGGGWE